MTEKLENALCCSFSRLLVDLQHTVRVGGSFLRDNDLCRMAGISTKTYAKIKEANIQTSPSI